MNKATIIIGDNRQTLRALPDQSIQTVITSPPYWGLRDYGTANWSGGDVNCLHVADESKTKTFGNDEFNKNRPSRQETKTKGYFFQDVCGNCGAISEDNQIGLETSPDDYVEQLCQVFDEVWRVLKDDGTLWLNLGDSYASFRDSKATPDTLRTGEGTKVATAANRNPNSLRKAGLKHKDLVGIPWRVAFALQARGWYLRQDIIWAKPNPMPESVTDRCTKSHEYLFLLTKSPKYYFDNEAIKEPSARPNETQSIGGSKSQGRMFDVNDPNFRNGSEQWGRNITVAETRNKRDVWVVTPSRYKEAHFATYPPELILPCILAGSKADDIVLDPFSGSGTTGVVAMQFGRNYIGLELNPEYASMSEKRLMDACGVFGEVEVRSGL
jgi:site-specific DNA-methyltransferase (cytosine-N4-specific)